YAPVGSGYVGTFTAVLLSDTHSDDDYYSFYFGHHDDDHDHDDDDHDGHGHDDDSSGTGGWVFTVNDCSLDYLAAGQTLTQTYAVTVEDGHGGSSVKLVTVVINGTNDAPVLGSSVATGAVTEIADGAVGENIAVLSSTGSINFGDVDLTDAH